MLCVMYYIVLKYFKIRTCPSSSKINFERRVINLTNRFFLRKEIDETIFVKYTTIVISTNMNK